ncbi:MULTISPECIES: glycosyltransferase family 2 protein [Paenibacillus]|uniref:Glycosyl transferase family 2 n=1 Tax=Paenibacillus odorifer TaxID=189426 RepID=A0A1R0Y2E7_9BACL|nr:MULTISPECIES: glycosyltransferase family 2 protein [Paenibacillus]AIQ38142.1 glycosyl transferase family 2 [Paenibacillus sp. FSL R5-0345]OMD41505.1 glycosyl transferase family 2 [Paenibacillus odorifer]
MKVLGIIPCFNEEENIESLIKELSDYSDILDFVIINDYSTDLTSVICDKNNANVINLPCNLGIGGAVQTGYIYAKKNNYDIAIQIDGDGQHNPAYIKSLIEPIVKDGLDFVIGSRFIEKEGFQSSITRRVGIIYFSGLLKLLAKRKVSDPTSGFRACNKKVIDFFANSYPTDYPEPESIMALSRNGYKIAEIPVQMRERNGGTSSIKSLKSIYYMIKVTLAIIIDFTRKHQVT